MDKGERWLGRRALARSTLAGLAATGLAPWGSANAAPADPGAGPLVTPNPIKTKIQKSGIAVELVDFSAPPRTSDTKPYALLNTLYPVGDGSGRLLTNDSRGKLWLIDRETGAASLVFDFAKARRAALVKWRWTLGFRSFAFHPSFARTGAPGYGKLYTSSSETPASRPADVRLFSGSYPIDHHDVVAEWTADPATLTIDPASRRELFRTAVYGVEHNLDQLIFDPNAKPGDVGYGKMFIGVGDGGNVPASPDPYNQAQNKKRALGKILRIDPLKQAGGQAYGIPADNPFVGKSGPLPEIWALGLRHPQNLSFDRGGSGTFLISDIGQHQIEEINLGIKGANYGWPLREGTFVTDRTAEDPLYALPADDATRRFTYPVAQYDHDEGKAVTGGYVYRGTAVPALVGHYLFGDIVKGRVFHVPVDDLKQGAQATIQELTLLRDGTPVTLAGLVAATKPRVDLRFGQDETGEVYIITKQDGMIRKMRAA